MVIGFKHRGPHLLDTDTKKATKVIKQSKRARIILKKLADQVANFN